MFVSKHIDRSDCSFATAQDVSRSAAWFTSLAFWAGGAAAIKKSDIAGAYILQSHVYIYNHIYIYRIYHMYI